MEKQICSHPENCVASKTNENINASKKHKSMGNQRQTHPENMVAGKTFENTNASRKHGIHGKNMFDHTSKTGELAKKMKTQTHAYTHGIH